MTEQMPGGGSFAKRGLANESATAGRDPPV
jgi:hypothetical protein